MARTRRRKSVAVEYRYGGNDAARLAELAQELVRLNVDVITTAGDLSARAAQQATTTIPIVARVGYPVEPCFAKSLSRPGGDRPLLPQRDAWSATLVGHGMATQMMTATTKNLLDHVTWHALVMRDNAGAHALYERMGFRDHQERVVRVVSRR